MSTFKITKDDIVKIIAGADKGKTGKVLAVLSKKQAVLVEGVGVKTRNLKPNQVNPRGGRKEIHVPTDISKVALVIDEATGKTSRVGVKVTEKGNVRVATQAKGKEIK